MIYSVNGTVKIKGKDFAVIECGGIGYLLKVTSITLGRLPSVGSKAELLTYMNVREDLIELYGFSDESEQNCFKLLIGVNGVGPKAALSILSQLSPDKFILAVASGDKKAITAAAGVGPKLASRIVLELKDKIDNGQLISSIDGSEAVQISQTAGNTNASEAISALVALGYGQSEAAAAVSKLPENSDVQTYIKEALKQLSNVK